MWKRRHFYYASFKINGPPSLPLLGNGLEFIGKNEGNVGEVSLFASAVSPCSLSDILQCLERLKNSYGFPMRAWLGPRFVVMLADPKDYQIILNHPAALSKDAIFRLTTVFSGKGLITCLDGINLVRTFTENLMQNSFQMAFTQKINYSNILSEDTA